MKEVLIIGAGPIAGEYSRISNFLGYLPVVIGRGEESAQKFETDFGFKVLRGGMSANLELIKNHKKAIVATSEDTLDTVVSDLIDVGIQEILVEKPGAKDIPSLKLLYSKAKSRNAKVFLGYNRRHFQSVLELQKRIENDGGLDSMIFEFTEWSHVISDIQKNPGVKENWLWHNSTHVIDLAFHIAGTPSQMSCMKNGELQWHPYGSRFVGMGNTEKSVLFSYHANWEGPGRWGLEFVTKNNRYFLRPMEELQCQPKGTVRIEKIELSSDHDINWKPGYFRQTKAFLEGEIEILPTLEEQMNKIHIYEKILGTN